MIPWLRGGEGGINLSTRQQPAASFLFPFILSFLPTHRISSGSDSQDQGTSPCLPTPAFRNSQFQHPRGLAGSSEVSVGRWLCLK